MVKKTSNLRPEQATAAVRDVMNAARQTLRFVAGMDEEGFRHDSRTRSAVLYQLVVLGEAAHRVPPELQAEHSELPWPEIGQMEDRLIRDYRRTDLGEVWRTVEKDLPEILRVLEPLVQQT
jgi:uncharacterized protein with HEPN domain